MKTGCWIYIFLLQAVGVFANTVIETLPYNIQHFTDEDGLPQNSVKYIAPDIRGFLWLATENGLVKFDGRQFQAFNGSCPAAGKRLFFVYPNATGKGLLALTENREVLSVHNGKVCMAEADANDYKYLQQPVEDTYTITGLPDNNFSHAVKGHCRIPVSSDSYYVVTADTISFERNSKEEYRFIVPQLVRQHLCLLQGKLCYFKADGKLMIFDKRRNYTARFTGDLAQRPDFLHALKSMNLYWNLVAGQVFIYTDHACYRIQFTKDGDVGSTLLLKNFDFTRNSIISLYHDDKYRRLFLGSATKGLYIATTKQFKTFKTGGENDEVYYAQARMGSDNIITPRGVAFDPSGKMHWFPLLDSISDPADQYGITVDLNGNYWYKKIDMVFQLNSTLTAVLWRHQFDENITQLYLDRQKRLWMGGNKKGLYMLNTAAAQPQPQLYSREVGDVTYITQETEDLLWIGAAKGLFRLHLLSRKVDTMPDFNGKYIRSLYTPRPGEVWITTYNDGIFLYRNGRFVNLPPDRQKYTVSAHCLVEDENGYLWITTNKGLFQISRKDAMAYADGRQKNIYYYYYGKKEGFNTNEFNGGCEPCALKLPDGNISLPSLDGLVYFNPANVITELPGKGIYIDQLQLDTKLMDAGDTILLPHNFEQLRLDISCPYFGDARNLQLYYSLEVAGKTRKSFWLPVNDNRTIEFSSLPSGIYNLRIRKINGFGTNNVTERVFRIEVERAWYETFWFSISGVGMFILLLFSVSRLHVRHIQKKNRVLESHVSARTEQLRQTLNDLQLSDEQLRKQAFMHQRLIAAISHDIRTPLGFLVMIMEKQDVGVVSREEQEVTYKSLHRMFHLVENLLQYMKSQFLDDNTGMESINLQQLAEEKTGIFLPVAQAKGVEINNTIPADMQWQVNRQLLAVVVHNLLDNAVKNTRNGSIGVSAWQTAAGIQLQVKDTGIGMPAAIMEWVNNSGREGQMGLPAPLSYSSLGLLIIMEFLQLINGRITVTGNAPAGTIVTITLAPVK